MSLFVGLTMATSAGPARVWGKIGPDVPSSMNLLRGILVQVEYAAVLPGRRHRGRCHLNAEELHRARGEGGEEPVRCPRDHRSGAPEVEVRLALVIDDVGDRLDRNGLVEAVLRPDPVGHQPGNLRSEHLE